MRRTLVRGLSRRSRRWSVLTRINPGSPCRRVHPLTNIRDLGEAALARSTADAARQHAPCGAQRCLPTACCADPQRIRLETLTRGDGCSGAASGRQRHPAFYGRASSTKLNGVSAARLNLLKPPPLTTTSRKRRSPACAPSAGPLRASETGTHTCDEAPYIM